jgi:O-antigen ligase
MRLYFWKAALFIIKEHPIFGVGTGDVQSELNITYIKTKSPLEPKWYKRPHNQFLTISVSLGLIGLLFFIFSLIYPLITLNKFLPILYWPFFILAINSFILEDTLESQAGISFFASFNTLFLCFAYFKKQQSLLD